MAPDPAQTPYASADVMAEIIRLREEHKQLFAEFTGYQQMLLALARRHGGVLVFDPAELAEVPASSGLVGSKAPDGTIIIRLVTP